MRRRAARRAARKLRWRPPTPLLPDPVRIHWGFFLALAVALFVYWFLWKTTLGFELRTVGASPVPPNTPG